MKKYFLIVCLLASISAVFAQTQHGYVKTRGRLSANGTAIPGTRLSGATITFRGNNSAVSGTNGAFAFAVANNTYRITNVRKNGYQLYDSDLLGRDHRYSSDDLLVVMDTPDNMLADRLESEKKIRRILRRQLQDKEDEIETLKEQHKITEEQYRKQLQELYAAQEKNEKLITEMAERYSTLDFDQIDDFRRRVIAYIQSGELILADSLLNTKGSMEERGAELDRMDEAIKMDAEDIAKRQAQHKKSVAMKTKALEDFAADCYSRHEICLLQHKNDSAAYWLELRASKDTTNYTWQLTAGAFLEDYLCMYERAMQYYKTALRCENEQLGNVHSAIAMTYNRIASIYCNWGDFKIGMEYFQRELDMDQELYGENDVRIASVLINIGYVLKEKKEYEKALDYYWKALEIYNNHEEIDSLKLATVYNNIGAAYDFMGKDSLALVYSKKAFNIKKSIIKEDNLDIALSYNNLGAIYEKKGDYKTALEYHNESLKIKKKLLGDTHELISLSYSNIGAVYMNSMVLDKAIEYYKKALAIRRKILPDNNLRIMNLYTQIGYLHWELKKRGNEQPDFKEFLSNVVFVAQTVEGDYPASKKGMEGEYVFCEFEDWTIDSDMSLFDINEDLRGKPKRLILMQDKTISQYQFENTIGVNIFLKFIGDKEKQCIMKAYKEWKGNK